MRVAVFVLALSSSGCILLARNPLPLRRICADGWPIKILQDRNCPDGICGYTCAPNRWREGEHDAQSEVKTHGEVAPLRREGRRAE